MFLRYPETLPDSEALLVTRNTTQCIELYVLANRDNTFSLVALAGELGRSPSREKLQGPYQTRAQAVAARAAVVQQLLEREYALALTATPRWRLDAQRAIRVVRESRQRNAPDCSFNPNDVYFD